MGIESVVVTLLAAWFLASVMYHCFTTQLSPWTARYDRFRFLALWKFFEIGPRNLEFESQYEFRDGSQGGWHSICLFPPTRSLVAAAWNPLSLAAHVKFTWVHEVIEAVDGARPGFGENLFACRALMHQVRIRAPQEAVLGQFRIVERLEPGSNAQTLFVSPLLPISMEPETLMMTNGRHGAGHVCGAKLQPDSFRRVA